MRALDKLNRRFGRDTVSYAAAGVRWSMRCGSLSPRRELLGGILIFGAYGTTAWVSLRPARISAFNLQIFIGAAATLLSGAFCRGNVNSATVDTPPTVLLPYCETAPASVSNERSF